MRQHQMLLAGPGRDHVQGGLRVVLVVAVAQRLAIDGDDFACRLLGQRLHPAHEAAGEGVRADGCQDAAEGVARRRAMLEVEPLAEPVGFSASERGDVIPALSAGDDGTEGDHEQVIEPVSLALVASWIIEVVKIVCEAGLRHSAAESRNGANRPSLRSARRSTTTRF